MYGYAFSTYKICKYVANLLVVNQNGSIVFFEESKGESTGNCFD